jgi:hypothetical protein
MKFNFDRMRKIASGRDKQVYEHPDRPDQVVAKIRFPEEQEGAVNERHIKGRFYLTKILHTFLPDFIPDIHGAVKTKDLAAIVSEKKEHDHSHATQNKLRTAFWEDADADIRAIIKAEQQIRISRARELDSDAALTEKKKILLAFGVKVDEGSINYSRDKSGAVAYLDNTFHPWTLQDGTLVRSYSPERIRLGIDHLETEEEKHKVEAYLNRLEALFEEERVAPEQQES